MPSTYIECPSCNWEGKIDDSLVGHQIKCPKCSASFTAEVGGTYDLVEEIVPAPPANAANPRRPTAAGPARPDPVPPKQEQEEADSQPRKSWLGEWPER